MNHLVTKATFLSILLYAVTSMESGEIQNSHLKSVKPAGSSQQTNENTPPGLPSCAHAPFC